MVLAWRGVHATCVLIEILLSVHVGNAYACNRTEPKRHPQLSKPN